MIKEGSTPQVHRELLKFRRDIWGIIKMSCIYVATNAISRQKDLETPPSFIGVII